MSKITNSKKLSQSMMGEAIRQQRRRLGMTQAQLATLIKTQSDSISRIERGHHQPSLARLEKIASALEISPEALIARASHSPSREILALLKEIESLHPDAQSFVLESLRKHIAFFSRENNASYIHP
jgi:transcriptional regulator with XRE-family HTH domain